MYDKHFITIQDDMKVLFSPLLNSTCLFLVVVCCLLFCLFTNFLVCFFYLLAQEGWTALIYAAGYGHTEVVSLLVERGADLDLQDGVSKTNKT